jgi:hypothetical protein
MSRESAYLPRDVRNCWFGCNRVGRDTASGDCYESGVSDFEFALVAGKKANVPVSCVVVMMMI